MSENEFRPASAEPGELISRVTFGPEALSAVVWLTIGLTFRVIGLDAGVLRCWLESQAIDRQDEPFVVQLRTAVIEAGGWPKRAAG